MLVMRDCLIKTGNACNAVLGYEGENKARVLRIKTTDDISDFASVNLLIDTLDCGAMKVETVSNYKVLSIVLTTAMLGETGMKTCQLLMMDAEGTVIKKTNQFYMVVGPSNVIEKAVPDSERIVIITDYIEEKVGELLGDIDDTVELHTGEIADLQNDSLVYRGTLSGDPTSGTIYPGIYTGRKTASTTGYPDDLITNRYTWHVYISKAGYRKNFVLIDSKDATAWYYNGDGYLPFNTLKLKGIKWAGIGDSLTYPGTLRASMKYYDYISRNTGISFTNLGVSGTGYKNDYNGAGTFLSRVNQIPDDANIVTIFGSVNDMSYTIGTADDKTSDTVMGCVYLTLQEIFTQKPNTIVGIISPTPTDVYVPYSDNKMVTFVEELRKLCEMYSVPFLDLFHNSNLRPWDSSFRSAYFSKDGGNGTHPDENGYKRFTPMIEKFVLSLVTKFY